MSVTSGFFNSLNGDRKYNAEQMSAIFDGIINNGVFANIGTVFAVKASTGLEVMVGSGRAWFNSAWLYNDTPLPVALEQSELVLNRYDAVVIEIDHTDSGRMGSIKVVKGTPGSSPSKPTLTKTDYINQYPLAYIYRAAGSTTISQSNIQNMIGTSSCPYITGILQVTNIDHIVAQWEGEWETWTGQWTQWEAAWNQWFAEQTENANEIMTTWMSDMRGTFDAWFQELQIILDGDVAGNLAAGLLELEERFTTLAEERAVYDEIQDSSDSPLLDSDSNPIEGRTVLGGTNEGITPGSIGAYSKDEADTKFAEKPVLKVVTLSSTGWSGTTQTVEVPGVLQDEMAQKITVAASRSSRSEYDTAGIQCTDQGLDSLTFTAMTVPSEDLMVLVTIEEVVNR